MTNDLMLGSIYLLMALMLVMGSIMTRREPWARKLTMSLAWLVIFGGGFVLLTFRDDLGYFVQRLKSEATGAPVIQGKILKIPQAIDGHFYVDATVNGAPVRFLVDSGATVTTIGPDTAARSGVVKVGERSQTVQTGNGLVEVEIGRAETLQVGNIERDNVRVHISHQEELNVLGMNYLSSLRRWGVEGRWLILES
jgi:aspartyl protease family protein